MKRRISMRLVSALSGLCTAPSLSKVFFFFLFSLVDHSLRPDQSLEPKEGDYNGQVRVGTPKQLLDASRSESGPILNALSFPLGMSGIQPNSLSSEIEAWKVTEGMRFCPSEGLSQVHYPASDM